MSSNKPTKLENNNALQTTKEELVNFDDKTKVEQLEEVLEIICEKQI